MVCYVCLYGYWLGLICIETSYLKIELHLKVTFTPTTLKS